MKQFSLYKASVWIKYPWRWNAKQPNYPVPICACAGLSFFFFSTTLWLGWIDSEENSICKVFFKASTRVLWKDCCGKINLREIELIIWEKVLQSLGTYQLFFLHNWLMHVGPFFSGDLKAVHHMTHKRPWRARTSASTSGGKTLRETCLSRPIPPPPHHYWDQLSAQGLSSRSCFTLIDL